MSSLFTTSLLINNDEKFLGQVVSGAELLNIYESFLASHTCTFGSLVNNAK